MASSRDPITCHVLDLTTGTPGVSIAVTLSLINPPSGIFDVPSYSASTNADGRVNTWTSSSSVSLPDLSAQLAEQGTETSVWSLKFQTGAYYGEGNTFFPEVEVRFFVKRKGGHYHVPLLLGPYSYTTYRGS